MAETESAASAAYLRAIVCRSYSADAPIWSLKPNSLS
jgi:hypothetical protein